jgi:hypothetical protein
MPRRANAQKPCRLLTSWRRFHQAHLIAKIYAALNDKEMAFSWLERGRATGTIGILYNDEPVWGDPIRSDPRFADLLSLMRIPQ